MSQTFKVVAQPDRVQVRPARNNNKGDPISILTTTPRQEMVTMVAVLMMMIMIITIVTMTGGGQSTDCPAFIVSGATITTTSILLRFTPWTSSLS